MSPFIYMNTIFIRRWVNENKSKHTNYLHKNWHSRNTILVYHFLVMCNSKSFSFKSVKVLDLFRMECLIILAMQNFLLVLRAATYHKHDEYRATLVNSMN